MSVGRRLMLSLFALAACTALLGAAAILGLTRLSGHFHTSEAQYQHLRALYEIGFQAASIRSQLNSGAPDHASIEKHLRAAAEEVDRLGSAGSAGLQSPALLQVRASINERLADISRSVAAPADPPALCADVNRWLAEVAALVAQTQAGIVDNRRRATSEFRLTLAAVLGSLAATLALAAIVGVRQYRSVMDPLRSLESGMTRIAGIDLAHRINEQGDREFRALIRHFNRMTQTIQSLHDSMTQQVETKSRELLRSGQLAGVGTLAAGLAHEMNNPLGIIAGYSQTTMRTLDRASTPAQQAEALATAKETLTIICEEAFRCRDIGAQLLQMAQPMDGDPQPVDAAELARRAVALVRHLPVARSREIHLRQPDDDLPRALGHASQLLQVLVNLIINALEACDTNGRVDVQLSVDRARLLIAVSDNGCGMDERTLARAFDPFYTDKPRRGLVGKDGGTGCGLGLSISHAIIQRHAGRLYAQSPGPGLGSTFTIDIPAAPQLAALTPERTHVALA